MSRAFVFPGQGSQAVGMGQALAEAFPAAREVLDEVDDALSQHLRRLMFEGPERVLTLTENAQPAIFAASLAALRVLESEGGFRLADKAAYVAGHSLGEYSALAAARAIGLADAARALKRRGRAMQEAAPVGAGAMAALLGLDLPAATEVAAAAVAAVEAERKQRDAGAAQAGDDEEDPWADPEICVVANDNAPGQVVVSGTRRAVKRAIEVAGTRGARKSVLLAVSAPFHSPLMAPAATVMAEVLGAIALRPPVVPVIANVTAAEESDPETIRRLLVEQVTAMVRWRESVAALRGLGVDTVVEIGTGKVLAGLVRRIDRELKTFSVGTPAEVEEFLKAL